MFFKMASDIDYKDLDEISSWQNGIFSVVVQAGKDTPEGVLTGDSYWYVFQATFYNNNDYAIQIASRSTTSLTLYIRKRAASKWTAWTKLH